MVLPVYKLIQTKLEKAITDFDDGDDPYHLRAAYQASLVKVQQYIERTMKSDYHLLATGMHPFDAEPVRTVADLNGRISAQRFIQRCG